MARLIKDWMRAKKGICSSDCECLTITWWKCYAEEHLCNCWEWKSEPVPPVPPVPEVPTYSIEKEEWTSYTIYSLKKEYSWWAEFVWLELLYDVNQDLESANATDNITREGKKSIPNLSDATDWANRMENAIAWTEEAETVFNEFQSFYYTLS